MVRCKLQEFLGAHRLTVAELARITGINRSTLTALRNGSAVRVELQTIEALCRHFGCTVGEMLELSDEKVRSP